MPRLPRSWVRRALCSVVLALLVLPLQGCPIWAAGAILDNIFPDTKPLLDTNWAKQEFAVISADTPRDELYDVEATYDDGDERDDDDLSDLSGDEDLGDVVVEMKAGIYLLEDETHITGAKSFTLRGAGASKTRLVLNTETRNSLKIEGARKVRLQGLTIAPFSADGVSVFRCDELEVEDVAFAGSLFGLRLRDTTARISSSVFAGCKSGIYAKDSKVEVREVFFSNCVNAMRATTSSFKVRDSYVFDNRLVIAGAVGRGTHLFGNLLWGAKQVLGWDGRPGLAAHNLVHFRALGAHLGKETNRELVAIDDFPDRTILPTEMDVVAVELTKLRGERRGATDIERQFREHRLDRADRMAVLCQEALRKNEVERARRYAVLALRYLGDIPLEDASEAVVAISGLGKP